MTLNGKWKLYYSPEKSVPINSVSELPNSGIPFVDATVPGNVELDLSAAGILPQDLFKGENILKAEEYETYEWWYEKTFIAPEAPNKDQKVVLHFGAVDCFADYYLNGEKIGESDNMFIAQDFEVTDKLLYGKENTIHVHISSAIIKGAEAELELNQANIGVSRTLSYNVRKAPHNYGWDIMPRAVSAGIWRDVQIRYVNKYDFKFLEFRLKRMEGTTGVIWMMFDTNIQPWHAFKFVKVRLTCKCKDQVYVHTAEGPEARANASGLLGFSIPNIKLWWPKHYGEPNLYDITAEILTLDDEVLMSKTVRCGFRDVKLHRSDIVKEGGKFEFVVNGTRIMATGTNWVPMDAYHSRDKSRYQRALEMADDLGCNIMRCWGGNVYEDHEFFDFCDEHGIMIWQDFAMACFPYPQNKQFKEKLSKEAEWVVKEYRRHPCIVLWAGDNEIDGMYAYSGFDPNKVNHLTREVLPDVVERHDPIRDYLPSSPYISTELFESGQFKQGGLLCPEDHLWGPRDYFKSDFYKNSNAYFVSEIGYHGCPSRESIEKFIDPEYVWPYENNKQWNLHSSDQRKDGCWSGRTMLMHKQVQQLFGEVPTDMDDYILASQISQAEAKKFFVEHMRAKMSRNGGIIWWNLIDGWPQMSDAIVDYYYDKKLAYDFIKRSQRDFIIMLDEMNSWNQQVLTANSSLQTKSGKVKITDLDSGKVYMEKEFVSGPNANTSLGHIPLMYSDKGMLLIEWELDDGTKQFNTYLYGSPAFDLVKYKEWLKKIELIEENL